MGKWICLIIITAMSGCSSTPTSHPKTITVVEAEEHYRLDCNRLGLASGHDIHGKDLDKALVEVANNADAIGANAVTVLTRDNTGGYVFVVALSCDEEKLARHSRKEI